MPGNDMLDARFHGHDNTLLLLLGATVFQQARRGELWIGNKAIAKKIGRSADDLVYILKTWLADLRRGAEDKK